MTADISPFLAGFPPFLIVFLPCVCSNVHPQPEARLLSNPDHTFIQSQPLRLYRRLGDCYFLLAFRRFSASPGSSSFLLGFLPVFRLPCCCGYFFVVPQQQQSTHSAPIFAAISHHFPTGYRFFRHFPRFLLQFPAISPRFSLVLPPILRFPSCRRFFLCSGGNKPTILPLISPLTPHDFVCLCFPQSTFTFPHQPHLR